MKKLKVPKGLHRQSGEHPPLTIFGNGSSGQHPYGYLVQSKGDVVWNIFW